MAELTDNFGLTKLAPGDDISSNGFAFLSKNAEVIDRVMGLLSSHDHTGSSAGLADPTTGPSLVLDSASGQIPAGTTVRYRFTYVDQYGAETAGSPETTINTPDPLAAPGAPTPVPTATGGTLLGGLYYYAVTAYTNTNTQETPLGQRNTTSISFATATNVVTLNLPSLPANADGFNVYRRAPGEATYSYLATVDMQVATPPTSYVDDGTGTPTYSRQPPSRNLTFSANNITVTLPGATPVVPANAAWKVYRTYTAGNWTSSSLHHVTEETFVGSGIITPTFLDVGLGNGLDTIPEVTQILTQPGKIGQTELDEAAAFISYTTAGRPDPTSVAVGTSIWNSTTGNPEWSDGTAWIAASGGGGATIVVFRGDSGDNPNATVGDPSPADAAVFYDEDGVHYYWDDTAAQWELFPSGGGSGDASKEVLDYVAHDHTPSTKAGGTNAPYWETGLTLQQHVEAEETSYKAPVRLLNQYHRFDEVFPQANENFLDDDGRSTMVALNVDSQRAPTVVTITSSGSLATVTHTGHLAPTGSKVQIAGANEPDYNGVFTITNTGANTYEYTMGGSPGGPATGSPTAAVWNRWVDIGNASAGGNATEVDIYNKIVAMASGLKNWARPAVVIFDFEPENYVNGGGGVAGDYISAYQNFVTIFRTEGASNVRFGFVGVASHYNPATAAADLLSNWYPGDAYVDIIGATAYSLGTAASPNGSHSYFNTIFQYLLDFSDLHPSKDLCISEFTHHWLEKADDFETGTDGLRLSEGTARTYQNDWEDGTPPTSTGWRASSSGTQFTVRGAASIPQEHAVLVGQPLGTMNQRAEVEVASINSPDADAQFGLCARLPNTYDGSSMALINFYGVVVTYTHIGATYQIAPWQFSNGHIDSGTPKNPVTISLSAGDYIGIEVEDVATGVEVRALLNDEVVTSWIDTSSPITGPTLDCVGMWMDSPGGANDRFEFDNFSFGTAEERVDYIETMGVHLNSDYRWDKLRWISWWDPAFYYDRIFGIGDIVKSILNGGLRFAVESEAWGKFTESFARGTLDRRPKAREVSTHTTLNGTYGSVNVDTSVKAITITLHDTVVDNGESYVIRRDGANNVVVVLTGSDTFSDGNTVQTLAADDSALGVQSIGDGEWKIVGTEGTVTGS